MKHLDHQQEISQKSITAPRFIQKEINDKESKRIWLQKHWKALSGAIIFTASLGITSTQFNKVEHDVIKELPVIAPSLIVTEGMAWTGAAMIFGSAGNKIGNPLTLKSRLSKVRDELEHNCIYKYGLAVNILGAIGTSTVVGASAVLYDPLSSWPLALTVAGASLGFSGLPWIWANNNHNNHETNVIIEKTGNKE